MDAESNSYSGFIFKNFFAVFVSSKDDFTSSRGNLSLENFAQRNNFVQKTESTYVNGLSS